MEDNILAWETIATFSWLQEATLLKSALEGSGIEAFIPEENCASINPFMTAMTVRVQVRRKDVQAARDLIQEFEGKPAAPEAPTCPHCGDSRVELRAQTAKNLWTFILGLIGTIPMRRHSRMGTCSNCGRRITE